MEIKKYYEKPSNSTNVIAMEVILGVRHGILDICFPDLNHEGNRSIHDINIDFLRRIFKGQFCSIERNGTRPSYRITLDNDIELYANSVVLIPSLDGQKTGLKQNVLHIGIPGKLIPTTCVACQPIFTRIESFFRSNQNLIELTQKESAKARRVIYIAVALILVFVYLVRR